MVRDSYYLTFYCSQGKALVAKALKDAGSRNGKVAIVTGANSGIGLEMSRMLASIGYKVILGCRSEANAKEAMGAFLCVLPRSKLQYSFLCLLATIKSKNESQGLPADLDFVQIDVSRVDSVKKFAETIKSKSYNVNLLINNAGIMFMPKQITAEGLEAHFAVVRFHYHLHI
jgi:NAD(P)-dependent dehydrogenase (short-subunit alcohol dehydrogenase family)